MELADLHVVEYSERVGSEDRQRAVQRDQVRRDRVAADAHEPDRESRRALAGQPGLEQADDTLPLLAYPHQQHLGPAFDHRDLVRRNDRDAAPGDELRAEQADGGRWHAPPGALTAEGRDSLRMGKEEGRLLPYL